jgi:uncharacterized protein (DUF488 family)
VTIWTIGHSTRTLLELVALLKAHRIDALADVRSFPTSQRHPDFRKEHLAQCLPEVDIRYRWLGKELGGFRKRSSPTSPHSALVNSGFRNYADHMDTEEFHQGVVELQAFATKMRVAIMCAEKLWWRCHRSLLSDYLFACCGVEIIHIVDEGKTEPHRLHRASRLVEGRLAYDVGEQAKLL